MEDRGWRMARSATTAARAILDPRSSILVFLPALPEPPEHECRPAEHDPQQRQVERDEQRHAQGGVAVGEAGEQCDDDEDQPDVVRLPHGPHRVCDRLPLLPPAGAGREQVPHPPAEVRPAEHGVSDQPRKGRRGGEVRERFVRHGGNPLLFGVRCRVIPLGTRVLLPTDNMTSPTNSTSRGRSGATKERSPGSNSPPRDRSGPPLRSQARSAAGPAWSEQRHAENASSAHAPPSRLPHAGSAVVRTPAAGNRVPCHEPADPISPGRAEGDAPARPTDTGVSALPNTLSTVLPGRPI